MGLVSGRGRRAGMSVTSVERSFSTGCRRNWGVRAGVETSFFVGASVRFRLSGSSASTGRSDLGEGLRACCAPGVAAEALPWPMGAAPAGDANGAALWRTLAARLSDSLAKICESRDCGPADGAGWAPPCARLFWAAGALPVASPEVPAEVPAGVPPDVSTATPLEAPSGVVASGRVLAAAGVLGGGLVLPDGSETAASACPVCCAASEPPADFSLASRRERSGVMTGIARISGSALKFLANELALILSGSANGWNALLSSCTAKAPSGSSQTK